MTVPLSRLTSPSVFGICIQIAAPAWPRQLLKWGPSGPRKDEPPIRAVVECPGARGRPIHPETFLVPLREARVGGTEDMWRGRVVLWRAWGLFPTSGSRGAGNSSPVPLLACGLLQAQHHVVSDSLAPHLSYSRPLVKADSQSGNLRMYILHWSLEVGRGQTGEVAGMPLTSYLFLVLKPANMPCDLQCQ